MSSCSYDEVAVSYRYLFPVHAVGYNWLQSNAESATRLSAKIDEFMLYYRQKEKKQCDYVILVSHSMGGLVSRWYSENLGGSKKALGILHGVMPATGSATAYKRVRAGSEMPAGIVLGRNAAEMTAVFAQASGPLQLLPCPEYGMGWLKIRDRTNVVSLPTADPYSEIYLERGSWWRLCDDKLINPTAGKSSTLDQDWNDFENLIKKDVIPFHRGLRDKYHSNTYAFYGDDPEHKTWGTVVWERRMVGGSKRLNDLYGKIDDLKAGGIYSDSGTGEPVVLQSSGIPIYAHYSLQPAAENGDGTVPIVSGVAPKGRVKLCSGHKGVDHEGAYKELSQRIFALWAIVKIAYRVKETKMAYAMEGQ